MKAFLVDKYQKKAPLRLADVAEPTLGDGEVLVRISAAGVNLLDAKIRSGAFKPILPYKLPLILGHDMAGTVVKVGPKATRFKVGDEVFSRVDDFRIGTFAESIAVKESALAAKPKTLSMEDAASVPLVALTAWQALVQVAKLRAGQRVFIQAGSGGVGTIAIQLAKHIGAYVATTASAANADWLKALGADLVIDYKTQDFETVLRDYDVVLHSQDARELEKSLNVLRPGGRLVSISGPVTPAFAEAIKAPWFLKPLFWALSRGTYSKARKRNVSFEFLFMTASGTQLQQIAALIDAGHIRPVIDHVYPFAETNTAIAHVESGRAKGKVVIKVR
ncbi:MAG: NADPH:quinone oxidoreductase [Pseudorhodobacter sp. PARRP1]|nr:MAG: NADPH:quinone oxidoreductase [Pseudorhodobacter sp. PARRP1]